MGIGAQASIWRRVLSVALSPIYFRRRFRTNEGAFDAFVSAGSGLRFLLPNLQIDHVHQRFIRDWVRPHDVVWDVGMNLGLFAIPASLKTKHGKVYGFEPDVELAANVLRSLRSTQNAGLNLSVISAALSDADGLATFQISKFSRALNKLSTAGAWHEDQVATAETRSVVTLKVDTLSRLLDPPQAMKIDVEGAEMQVLEGGEATIERYRPAILIEGPKELAKPMGDFFRKHGYALLDGGRTPGLRCRSLSGTPLRYRKKGWHRNAASVRYACSLA